MATRNQEAEEEYKNHRQGVQQMPSIQKDPEQNAFDKYSNPMTWSENRGIKFSFVYPSRERVDLLDQMIRSVSDNAYDRGNVEILVAVDEDDKNTQEYFFSKDWPLSFVKVFKVKRSLNFSRDYYTFLAHKSVGRWIITANDDCIMETADWDVLAYNALKDKSGVIYGWIEDNLGGWRAKGHGNYCCFPLQGRAGFEALGYIFPTRVPTWGADIWAKNLYDQVGSVVEVPIKLNHYCHHNKTRNQDHISKRIAFNQVPFDMRPTYEEVNKLLGAKRAELAKV